jgi:3-phenylpropionate/trans-cinnamate dioxygenase ferredoxin subunit
VKYVVAATSEIPPGERKIINVAGRSIGIFNIDGEYFALRNRCPHQGGALCEGTLWGVLSASAPGQFEYNPRREILTCPWHGWEFHVRTGQSWCDPVRLRVRRFEVSVEEGRALATTAQPSSPPAPGLVHSGAPAPGLVRGPYVVETYPVSVEGTYLVVDVPTRGGDAAAAPSEEQAASDAAR